MRRHVSSMVTAAAVGVLLAAASVPAAGQGLLDELALPSTGSGSAPGLGGAAVATGQVDIGALQPVWDAVCDRQRAYRVGQSVKRWTFSPDETLCVETRDLVRTRIILPENETVEHLDAGKSAAFEITVAQDMRHVINVRPRGMVGADTIVHVAGRLVDGRRNYYSFYVRSYPIAHDEFPDSTVFVEVPPTAVPAAAGPTVADALTEAFAAAGPAVGGKAAQPAEGDAADATRLKGLDAANAAAEEADRHPPPPPDWIREVPFNIGDLRFGEWSICPADEQSRKIAPERVFNDHHFVYIDYGSGPEADSILRGSLHRVVDEVDNPANFRVTGPRENMVVVEHMGYDLTITNGDRLVCLKYRRPC